ncbi:hypothetical protein Y1Q_0005285 [Alligator mississippiensis]|uniref:Uncharacterized protein n=1 Tax=Alligator mississippiensis TaxID=8496 RepID=A0A151MT95_ALLMI|nr:hypothetical protein Y1Q_0005285 [Alligator mississippiensis]
MLVNMGLRQSLPWLAAVPLQAGCVWDPRFCPRLAAVPLQAGCIQDPLSHPSMFSCGLPSPAVLLALGGVPPALCFSLLPPTR